jgi:type I restriction enzyme S subunit
MSEVANIPQLRFPGFSDEWEERPLKDVSTFFNGKAYKQAELLSSGKYPVLRVGNFFTNNSWYYSNLELDENKYCDNGDLLYAWSASFGPRIWAGEKVIYHYHIWKVINHSQVTKKFLFIVLDNETAKMKAQSANGFALLHITKGTIENWKINLPTRQEQQKIAAFLTAVDNKIEQLSKKQALLGSWKKGLMQQIFSQAIRFKADDGSDFPDWEEKKLGGVVDNVGGTALEKYTNPKETHKFISIGNYGVDGKYIDNGQRVELNNKTKTKLLDKDNLVMVLNDKTAAGNIVGSTILIDESDSYIYNQRSERLICKSELFPIFAWHYLNSKIFRKSVYSISQGGTQIYVNFPSVKELNFSLPSLLEQTKIANFLSSIDTKIEQVGGQLDESKQFKKALLQQMFV